MTVGFDPYVGARFIRAKLVQHAGLSALVSTRVFRDVAPDDAVYPYVLMGLVSAEDLRVIGEAKLWTNMLWQVEFWSRTNDDAVIAQGAALIDAALHNTSGSIAGATYGSGDVWSVVRERPLSLPAEVSTDRGTGFAAIWRRGGGEYRQLAQAGVAA